MSPPPWCDPSSKPRSREEIPLRSEGWAWDADWQVEIRAGSAKGSLGPGASASTLSSETDGSGWQYAKRFDHAHWSATPKVRALIPCEGLLCGISIAIERERAG